MPTLIELCAGAGGQALGLEQAGFEHLAAVEIDRDACATLRANRPEWNVMHADVRAFTGAPFHGGVDLLAAGVPCPPFSIAGKQLGADDERDLFPEALRLVEEITPRAVLIENVKGLGAAKFKPYREHIRARLQALGYVSRWRLLDAKDFGLPQTRSRYLLVAMAEEDIHHFQWPTPDGAPPTVGERLIALMASRGWPGAEAWSAAAAGVGPTVVGGSKKHGGPDLGPTRARKRWAELGVDGLGIANEPPGPDFPEGKMPRLTVEMVAQLQGFPDAWVFAGRKTARYRQVSNALPPPLAAAVGTAILNALAGVEIGGDVQRVLVAEKDAPRWV